MLLLDLDELEALDTRLRRFAVGRFALTGFAPKDHLDHTGRDLRGQAQSILERAGLEGGGPVRLLAMPRILGGTFNPLTVWFLHRRDGALSAVLYEVNNTFGGRHSYVIPVGDTLAQSAPKHFFVSPFNAVEGHYTFNFTAPQEKMALGVALSVEGKPVLKAYVSGTRRPLTDANLLRSFLGIPLLTLKVTAAIHLHALKLWWKGLKLRRRPPGPNHTVDFLPEARSQP